MGNFHCNLLLHTSVHRLSRDQMLQKVLELRKELLIFFKENQFSLFCRLRDPKWLQCLACMADIFCKLNDFNLSLQGKYTSLLSMKNKIRAIKRNLKFCCENVNIDHLACFPLLQNFLEDNNLKMDSFVKSDIVRHLREFS